MSRSTRIVVGHLPGATFLVGDALADAADAAPSMLDPRAGTIYEAYKSYPKLTPALATKIVQVADNLGTNAYDLANLIRAESGFDASVGNTNVSPEHRPVGLIQFIPVTARSNGTTTAALARMPAVEQMDYVQAELNRHQPLDSKQRLYMSVFYPIAQDWPSTRQFSDDVWQNNPIIIGGKIVSYIKSPGDYVRFVDMASRLRSDGQIIDNAPTWRPPSPVQTRAVAKLSTEPVAPPAEDA